MYLSMFAFLNFHCFKRVDWLQRSSSISRYLKADEKAHQTMMDKFWNIKSDKDSKPVVTKESANSGEDSDSDGNDQETFLVWSCFFFEI